MKLKPFPIFFEGEGDDFAGGNPGDVTQPTSGGNAGGGQSQQTTTPPPQQVTLDPKAFEQFGQVIADQFKQVQPQAPKTPPTEAELAEARRQLNFWEPDDAFLQEFGNAETQKAALIKFRDGLMKQFITIAQGMLAQQDGQWNERFQPVAQMLTAREEAEREARFHAKFPVLAKPELKPLIASVAQQLAQQNKFNGLTEDQAFTALATGVETVIKATYPDFNLGAAASQSQGRSSNSITPSTSGSGGGGGAGAGTPKGSVPIAAQVLGPVKSRK